MTEILMFALGVILALVLSSHDASLAQINNGLNVCVTNGGLEKMTIEFGGITNIKCSNGATFRQKREKQ